MTDLRRAVAAAFVLLLPLAPGLRPGFDPPPPPRFVPVHSDVHVIVHGAGQDTSTALAPNAVAADTTLLSKTAGAASVAAGGTLHYSITLTNATPLTRTFLLTDALPASVSYVTNTASGGFSYDMGSNTLTASPTLSGFQGDIFTPSGAPPYTEISGTGLSLCPNFLECDDNSLSVTGLPFRYLGVDYNSVTADSNGFIMPGSVFTTTGDNLNQHLPDSAKPNNVIAPFWADLDLNGSRPGNPGGGEWYYGELTDGNADYFVFEWLNAQQKGHPENFFSFQVWIQLHAEHITFAYQTLHGDTSHATIGFENSDGTLGGSYLYNGAGTVPTPPTVLQISGVYETALLGYDVQANPNLRGCSLINNSVSLSSSPGNLARTASSSTAVFGPCLFLSAVSG